MKQNIIIQSIFASLTKTFRWGFGVIIAVFLIGIVFFRVELSSPSYDVVFKPLPLPNVAFGVTLDGRFELWKIVRGSDGTMESLRLFP